MPHPPPYLLDPDPAQRLGYGRTQHLPGPGRYTPQLRFHPRPAQLDRIQLGAVTREVEHADACRLERGPDRLRLVSAQVVHDDHVTRGEGRDQRLDHEGEEPRAGHRPVVALPREEATGCRDGPDDGEVL